MKPNRILIVSNINYRSAKMFLDQSWKFAKGFIRLGCDVKIFSYNSAVRMASPLKSKNFLRFFKSRADDVLIKYVKSYLPQIVLISFPEFLDYKSLQLIKDASPGSILIGFDGDPWPKLQKDNRIETAKKLDILLATNNGQYLEDYRSAGVKKCFFIPNLCDPDIEHPYDVGPQWKSDILWTGKVGHSAYLQEDIREQIVSRLVNKENCRVYGCLGQEQIGGLQYLYAISGAKIGVSINAVNSVRMYHSDRLTYYLSCGTLVLAKNVPDSNLLFRDKEHLRYFETAEEFFDLADWYLKHNDERLKIANAGMEYIHSEFNCTKIAGYILDCIDKGRYAAPWMT